MDYPQDFIDRVKQEYPDWHDLHACLDRGDDIVGISIDSNLGGVRGGISPSKVLELIDRGQVLKLREKAAASIRRLKLLNEWREIRDSQTEKVG